MALSISALTTELQTDPNGYGYAARIAAGDDVGLATLLNLPRDGTNGGPAINVRNISIMAHDLLESITFADMVTTLPAINHSWFESATQQVQIFLLNEDGSNTRMLNNLLSCVTNPSPSRNRINALANKTGSRAEQLFGTGVVISTLNIAQALGRG